MFSYNDLENESNILFDNSERSFFKIDDRNNGDNGNNGKRDDVFEFLKKYLVMIFFAVSISLAGVLCILIGRTEFTIFLGFAFFACAFPVAAVSQFIANKIAAFLNNRKNKDK